MKSRRSTLVKDRVQEEQYKLGGKRSTGLRLEWRVDADERRGTSYTGRGNPSFKATAHEGTSRYLRLLTCLLDDRVPSGYPALAPALTPYPTNAEGE